MDIDDILPRNSGDPLGALAAQDLDRLSVGELRDRIGALEREILRTRGRIEAAVNHKSSAEGLFKR